MLFLSKEEQREWAGYAEEILKSAPAPAGFDTKISKNKLPAFHFYLATFLAAKGAGRQAIAWAESGALMEDEGFFGCAFLLGFLHRYDHELRIPARVFEDPRPFIHFTTVPFMAEARRQFVQRCGESLPVFEEPIRFMDIGCGDGALTVAFLKNLMETKKGPGILEVLLIDPSPAMAALAEKTVRAAFPEVAVSIEHGRIQDCSERIDRKIDIAMSSLAYHHMPVEDKRLHLARLRPWIDHLVIFEMDANNDTPELYTPALALSVYQSYGRIFDAIYAHDGPVEIVNASIDSFLMTEVVSILTEPRGKRSDYHMLRGQWNMLLADVLGPAFSCRCDAACYEDEYLAFFALHYCRDG
jgi:ubiquinone/menaquinone biosynthesis C-methylase UbiE